MASASRASTAAGSRFAVTTTSSPAWAARVCSCRSQRESVVRASGSSAARTPSIVRKPSAPDETSTNERLPSRRDERRFSAPGCVHLEDGAGRAHRLIEAGVPRLAACSNGVAVEKHDDRVPRRVLELLHHQLPAAGSGGPVHATERLALRVLAHRVEVEARRDVAGAVDVLLPHPSGVAEQRLQLDEPRVHDHGRARRIDGQRDRLEPEVVAELDSRIRDRKATSTKTPEVEIAPRGSPVPLEPARVVAEPVERAVGDDRTNRHARRPVHFDPETNAVALDGRSRVGSVDGGNRSSHESGPDARASSGKEETYSRHRQRARTEHQRGKGDACSEQERATQPHAGTRVSSSACCTTSRPIVPAARASGETMTRCESTARAIACTSSGST